VNTYARSAFTLVAAALLAGCSAMQPPAAAPAALPPNSATRAGDNGGRSWMDASARKWDLLYVSNALGPTVNVYRFWQRKLVGVLTGFDEPLGECVDAAGDVYVTDHYGHRILEFAHGGASPINVIRTSLTQPSGCAVDLKTGDLAVADDSNLLIYRGGKGRPKAYTGPLTEYASCAYDDKGDLLVTDGLEGSSGYGSDFAWLRKGSGRLVPIKLHGGSSYGAFNDVGGIAWDGQYFGIDGTDAYLISQERISRRRGRLAGQTRVDGPVGQLGPIAIYNANGGPGSQGTEVVGAVAWTPEPTVYFWKYPSGGPPVAEILTGLDRPLGLAISLKQRAPHS
jgi:hypothetical protein